MTKSEKVFKEQIGNALPFSQTKLTLEFGCSKCRSQVLVVLNSLVKASTTSRIFVTQALFVVRQNRLYIFIAQESGINRQRFRREA